MDTSLKGLSDLYQWHYRPQRPERPAWFTAWPQGARIAVMLIILHEWESVPRSARPMPKNAHHTFDFLSLGAREYGARFGIYRILDILDRHGVKASMMCSGLMCDLFPETINTGMERGHELGTHQWDQAIHPPVFTSKDEERVSLSRATAALEKLTGKKTLGYMSQGPRPTPHTLEICVESGFRWTCDFSDSDVPYTIDVDGKKMVSVGYVMPGYTDSDLGRLGFGPGLEQLIATYDAVYEESARHPMKFCYVLHNHLSGRPALATILDRFLTHVRSKPGAWFCRGIDMAEFWMSQGSK